LDEARERFDETEGFDLAAAAGSLVGGSIERRRGRRAQPEPWYPVSILESDVVFDAASASALRSQMFAGAQRFLLVVWPDLDIAEVLAAEGAIVEALKRGVRVDILWGGIAEDQHDTKKGPIAALTRIAATASDGPDRRLHFNRRPAGINSSLLIGDGTSGMRALVGCPDFSDMKSSLEAIAPAIQIRDPGLIAGLSRTTAGWWAAVSGEEMSASVDRWRRLASECERSAVESSVPEPVDAYGERDTELNHSEVGTSPNRARIIVDSDHMVREAEFLGRPPTRLLVCSTTSATACSEDISRELSPSHDRKILVWGPLSEDGVDSSGSWLGVEERNTRAPFLLVDNHAVFGLHEPFKGTGQARPGHEMSVEISGPVVDEMWVRLVGQERL
jgi:hypothetical protein